MIVPTRVLNPVVEDRLSVSGNKTIIFDSTALGLTPCSVMTLGETTRHAGLE
jgi:hypothetical protein